jgi:hypothetical protein
MALPEDRRLDPRKFPEKARKLVDPRAPEPMKMMAAKGMVPLKPLVQVCVLHNLAHEGRDGIRNQCEQTLRGMPAAGVVQICKQRLMPVVLDWIVGVCSSDREVVQAVLLNAMTDVDTLAALATTADEGQCEMLASNQVKVLSSPALVQALYFNRNLRASTADKMIDLCVRNEVDLSSIPGYEEIVAAAQGIEAVSAEEAAAQDAAFKAVQAELADVEEDQIDALVETALEAPPEEAEQKKGGSAAGRIRDMNISQRVRLASVGTSAERAILVRDANKIVARAAIRSSAVSEQDVRKYAKDKRILDEVIMHIARKKKWVRHYQIKLALVNNPKCPMAEAMRFLPHLRTQDLRMLARSKGISAPLAKAAKMLAKVRMK